MASMKVENGDIFQHFRRREIPFTKGLFFGFPLSHRFYYYNNLILFFNT